MEHQFAIYLWQCERELIVLYTVFGGVLIIYNFI